jgi:lipopolysaccharide/colanic/teichoic acid biosynthesis glycosyltransferase
LFRENVDERGLRDYLWASAERIQRIEVAPPLSVQNLGNILASNVSALQGEFHGLLITGRVEGDIRLSRNVMLHPSARLVPPVFIGENCEVEAGARVGPNVVIGSDCVIDRYSSLRNSVVLGSTYVGERMELDGTLVAHELVFRSLPSRPPLVEDACAVSSLAGDSIASVAVRMVSMGVGFVLLLLAALPLLGVAAILKIKRKGTVCRSRCALRLPTKHDDRAWTTFELWSFCSSAEDGEDSGQRPDLRHLFLQFLPALVNVARGDLCLVGLPARTPDEVRSLAPDWRALYLRSKAGILNVTLIDLEFPTEEEAYAAEGGYAVAGGLLHDFGLLIRYVLAVVGARKKNVVLARDTGRPVRTRIGEDTGGESGQNRLCPMRREVI